MINKTNGVSRVLALTVLFVLALTCFVFAQAETARAGYISNFRTLDGEPAVGVETRYKLTIRKSGQVTAVLTNRETGVATTVHDAWYGSAQNILLTVPGELIENNHNYVLNVSLVRNGQTIGQAAHSYSTVAPVARIDALSVTGSFKPQLGEALNVSFQLPSSAYVTAVVKNAGGQQVAVLASNAAYQAGNVNLSWSGVLSDNQLAAGGSYTVEVYCVNKGGTSPAVSASFQISGDTGSVLSGRVQGTIQSILLPQQPDDGDKPSFTVRASQAGRYTLKLKDLSSGKSVKLTGNLQAGANIVTVDLSSVGGNSYIIQMIEQVSGRTVGKAELRYTAKIDPPSMNISASDSLKAGYGAALPITYTTGTTGYAALYITDTANTTVYARIEIGTVKKGTNTVYWNGKGLDGKLLASGTYQIYGVCDNAIGTCCSNILPLQYEGAIESYGTPATQGAITLFAAAETPEPVERTPLKFRVHTTATGTLKVTLRDIANNGKAVLVYNARVTAGMNTITIPGDYLGATSYELKTTLTANKKTVGKAIAYVKPRMVMPEVTNFVCSDTFQSKWGDAYELSFDTVSTGYLHVRVEDAQTGAYVRYINDGTYSAAGHYGFFWDGCNDSGKMVEPGLYRVVVVYVDSYGNYSNFATKEIRFEGPNYPEGVYGYAVVGLGTHKTPIHIYDKPNGSTFAVTYGISATFKVMEDLGDWLYVETSGTIGGPVKGYVKANRLQKIELTSPYRIEVNISRKGANAQTFYLYYEGELIDTFKVSTGKVEGTTPVGTFCLLNRKPYFTVLGGGGICYDTLRVVGGVCIHRIPMIGGSYKTTEPLLGTPASHGCIRVPVEKSSWLYENIPDTTIIQTYYSK